MKKFSFLIPLAVASSALVPASAIASVQSPAVQNVKATADNNLVRYTENGEAHTLRMTRNEAGHVMAYHQSHSSHSSHGSHSSHRSAS